MLITLLDLFAQATKWSNDNQGIVSVAIFVFTIVFGWATGIFSALRRKPKFKLSLIDGPTFCCTYAHLAFSGSNTRSGGSGLQSKLPLLRTSR